VWLRTAAEQFWTPFGSLNGQTLAEQISVVFKQAENSDRQIFQWRENSKSARFKPAVNCDAFNKVLLMALVAFDGDFFRINLLIIMKSAKSVP
jgi:hypothetical protein